MTDTTMERHFTVDELAAMWKWGKSTVRRRIRNEPGVLRNPYRVPESVAKRIHFKYTNKEGKPAARNQLLDTASPGARTGQGRLLRNIQL